VYPAAHRAACGKAAVVKTAAETAQKQNRARILPAYSAKKSRLENGTPQDQTTLPDDTFRQSKGNLKETMRQKPRFRTLRAAHIHILSIKRRTPSSMLTEDSQPRPSASHPVLPGPLTHEAVDIKP
jgi:hypothetical protein